MATASEAGRSTAHRLLSGYYHWQELTAVTPVNSTLTDILGSPGDTDCRLDHNQHDRCSPLFSPLNMSMVSQKMTGHSRYIQLLLIYQYDPRLRYLDNGSHLDAAARTMKRRQRGLTHTCKQLPVTRISYCKTSSFRWSSRLSRYRISW